MTTELPVMGGLRNQITEKITEKEQKELENPESVPSAAVIEKYIELGKSMAKQGAHDRTKVIIDGETYRLVKE